MRSCSWLAVILFFGFAAPQWSKGADAVFGLTTVHDVHVTVSAEDYAKMEPPPRSFFGPPGGPNAGGPQPGRPNPGGPPPQRPPANRPAPGSPDFGAGNFGFEFAYVPATVELNGQRLDNVGLRYKGSGTYMMSQRHVKRSLKFDFDKFDDQQTWQGLKKLNLNSGVMDPSKSREALAYTLFHAAGVPASRTSFADATLTVPGKFDREPLGLFTVVEQVSKPFLKAHFNRGDGLLLKPEGIRGLPHFGDDPEAYKETYNPKEDARPEDWKRLVELTRLINVADEEEFRERIGEFLDLDSFASFVAANTVLASMDGFLGMGHNYYLYLSPETNKFVFIPWDLDLSFGSFNMYGSPEQLADLSIAHPHVGDNKLIDRLFAMPDWQARYRGELERISREVLADESLLGQLAEVEAAIETLRTKDQAAADKRGERSAGGLFGATPLPLKSFIERRTRSIDDQLTGKSKGYVPSGGFGPGGFGRGGFGPPGSPPIAPRLLAALDADKNGSLSEQELVEGMSRLSGEWDTDKDGELSQQELADGLQGLSPGR